MKPNNWADFYSVQDQRTGEVLEVYTLHGQVYKIKSLLFETFRYLTTKDAQAKYWVFLN